MDEKDKQTINNRQLTIDKGNEETMQHSRENNIASRKCQPSLFVCGLLEPNVLSFVHCISVSVHGVAKE